MKLTPIIVDITISLAEQRRNNLHTHNLNKSNSSVIDLSDISLEMNMYDKNLLNFLQSLDQEVVEYLEGLMYLGRDNDYLDEPDPMKRLELSKEYCSGFGHSATTMYEKLPLNEYLQQGKKIIGWE